MDMDCDNENCEADVQMKCAPYLCIVAVICVYVILCVCGCNGVHTWIEEAVSKCDDAFECVVVLDQYEHGNVASVHEPSRITHSIYTPSFKTSIASSSSTRFALSFRTLS